MDAALEEERPSVETKEKSMEAIDELISAAQTFYDDARANENGRSRSWEHCYRVFRDARTDPSPDYDYLSLHLAFYLASWGMYRGSSFLLQKDYKVLSPVVEEVLNPEYDCLFGIACADLRESEVQGSLEKLNKYIAAHFGPIRMRSQGVRLCLLCRQSSLRKYSWEHSGACRRTTGSSSMASRNTR